MPSGSEIFRERVYKYLRMGKFDLPATLTGPAVSLEFGIGPEVWADLGLSQAEKFSGWGLKKRQISPQRDCQTKQ